MVVNFVPRYRREVEVVSSETLSEYLPSLPYHLSKAGRMRELRDLLFRFAWLEAQVRRVNVAGAITDCDLLSGNQEIQILRRVLVLSRNALMSNPDQLAFQLYGRLVQSSGEMISSLLKEARNSTGDRIQLHPLKATLQLPDANLQWTIQVSQESIDALVEVDEGVFACAVGGKIQIWKSGAEQSFSVLKLDNGAITHLACLSGDRLLSGADNGSIDLWDLKSTRKVGSFKGHTSAISALAVSGETFVSAASNCALLGWYLHSPEPTRRFVGHERDVKDVVFIDKRCFASVGDDRSLRLWSFSTGKQIGSAQLRILSAEKIAFWKKRHFITGTFAGGVSVWKIFKRALKEIRYFRYPAVGHNCLIVLKRDLGVSGVGGVNGLRPWNPQLGKSGPEVYVPGGEIVSCVKTGQTSVLCGTKNGYVSRVRVPFVKLDSDTEEDSSPVYSVAAINDEYAASSAGAGRIWLWDSCSGNEVGSLQGKDRVVSSISVLGDDRLAAIESGSTWINIWNARACKHLASIDTKKKILFAHSFSPRTLIVAPSIADIDGDRSENDKSETVDLWDIDIQEKILSLPKLPFMVSAMLSISSRFLVLGTYDSPILHLDISTCKHRRNFQLTGHSKGVVSLAVLKNGFLASGSIDMTIRFWDLKKRACVAVLRGHEKEVTGLAPLTSRYLASASQDQTIRIWDTERECQIHRVDCDAGLQCIAATPDGTSLIAGDERGQVHFIKVENLAL